MKSPKIIAVRIVLVILTALVMIFIYRMSAMDAENSSQLSTSVGYTVGQVVVEGFDELPSEVQGEYVESIEHPLRKLAHFTEFTALGFLLIFDILVFCRSNGAKRFLISLIIGLLYAASDEIHQIVVSGRSCEFKDVMIDTGGVLTGCVIASIIISVIHHIKYRYDHAPDNE